MHVVVRVRRTDMFLACVARVSAIEQVPHATSKLGSNLAVVPATLIVCLALRNKEQLTYHDAKHRTHKAPLPHSPHQTLRLEHVRLIGSGQQLEHVPGHHAQHRLGDVGGDGWVRIPALDRRQVLGVLQGRRAVRVDAHRNAGDVHGQGEREGAEPGREFKWRVRG
ncbi:hypothetical protein BU14_0057s0027 [Porphyra umbilicalis]|uniref:Uncharacterized protein n=1 Tax=Porphyra umbilicalis TaxID=2786 RepID=A0A1X6PHJ3_PORUM|nr:hypothetical protein BU14_0057s0027 [Porphyra umbilicalis]|eukprot:OSX80206.1 hypothetical protein BU14_0057s0027 [Porphyra umbilicalis]